MKSYIFRVELTQDPDGRWNAVVPVLPACYTWGNTKEEALASSQEAVTGYIETLIQEGLPIPPRVKASDEPQVSVVVSAA